MSTVDFSEFTWFIPKEKGKPCITIPNSSSINLSPKFAVMLPEQVTFGIRGIDTICVKQDNAGYRIPKSGSIKAMDLISALIDRGLSIPAKYTITYEGSYWLATLEMKSTPTVIDPSTQKGVEQAARRWRFR